MKRLWSNAEAQVAQIEARMKQSGQAPDDSERDARTLAILIRMLRELSAFDEAKRGKDKQQQKPANDETGCNVRRCEKQPQSSEGKDCQVGALLDTYQ